MEAENLLAQMEQRSRRFLPSDKNKTIVHNKMVNKLAVHDKKSDMLYKHVSFNEQVPHHGNHIPVKELKGQGASKSLEELQHLLLDAKVGRIAIRGVKGIGKTSLMKHLHNSALKGFAYVFWVTSPDQFSFELVQDAVAAVVKCDFSPEDDMCVRARKLSKKLGDLDGCFVLFLDGVPSNAKLSLDQIGIPVPAEGSECKLVVASTSSETALGCTMLHSSFRIVEVDHLSESEAFELLIHEAKIDMGGVTFPTGIPRLVAKKCHGVPRKIVDIASCVRGIDDLREWRNLLFELESFEKKTSYKVMIDELEV